MERQRSFLSFLLNREESKYPSPPAVSRHFILHFISRAAAQGTGFMFSLLGGRRGAATSSGLAQGLGAGPGPLTAAAEPQTRTSQWKPMHVASSSGGRAMNQTRPSAPFMSTLGASFSFSTSTSTFTCVAGFAAHGEVDVTLLCGLLHQLHHQLVRLAHHRRAVDADQFIAGSQASILVCSSVFDDVSNVDLKHADLG